MFPAQDGLRCARCHGTGYRGRMPLFEVMSVRSPLVRRAVLDGAREGMARLGQAAAEAVVEGLTSLDEALPFLLGDCT